MKFIIVQTLYRFVGYEYSSRPSKPPRKILIVRVEIVDQHILGCVNPLYGSCWFVAYDHVEVVLDQSRFPTPVWTPQADGGFHALENWQVFSSASNKAIHMDDDLSGQILGMAMENKAIKLFVYSYAIFNTVTILLLLFLVVMYLKSGTAQ